MADLRRGEEREPTTNAPRALALVVGTVVIGAGAIVVLAGILAVSFGLLVVSFLIGRALGSPVRTLLASRSPVLREAVAAGLAVGTVAIGMVGVWLYAQSEGGVLPLGDYLAQTFGALVPLQLLVAGAVGWWSAR